MIDVYDLHQATKAYGNAEEPTRSLRDIEYLALARLSHALRATAKKTNENFPDFADAVAKNLAFWNIVAADVSTEKNPLPAELRERLFLLARFVQQESRSLLRGDGDVETLVSINLALMNGLRPGGADK